jgi:hypothetical protein
MDHTEATERNRMDNLSTTPEAYAPQITGYAEILRRHTELK